MKPVLKEILSSSLYILTVLCLTYVIIHYVGQRTEVEGSSMESTLSNNDNLIVEKLSYRFGEPERFDIVVFPFKYQKRTYFIKRIIGLPGETIQIDEAGNIYIDGAILDEDYGREVIQNPGMAIEPIKLKSDEYFVMGDNRNNSTDSRDPSVGPIKKSDLIGRAVVRIYPFDKICSLTKKK